jgi:GT2 family glycosyltransferase
MPAASPTLTVVVPTHDRRPILALTLDALARQSRSDFSIVVVDDGSSDDTWPWLERRAAGATNLSILRQANGGQGAARNRALREVDADLVLFLGDDILPAPELVAEHLRAHAASPRPCAVVGFIDWCRARMRVTPALEMANLEGHQFGFARMTPGEVSYRCFYTSNLSIRRDLLGDEPFDPAFRLYGWEDVELGYRLHRRGIPLIYHPEARAEHLHPMTFADLYRRQRRVGEAFHTLLALHPELASADGFTPSAPPRWFALGRLVVPPLVPLLSRIDRLGVPLGRALLHRALLCGYYLGLDSAPAPSR